jgi:hypothetical protein
VKPYRSQAVTRPRARIQNRRARRRILGVHNATGSAGFAQQSQRQLPTDHDMRFRPANISLINRRHLLPRLWLTLSLSKKRPAQLDRSLHISGTAVGGGERIRDGQKRVRPGPLRSAALARLVPAHHLVDGGIGRADRTTRNIFSRALTGEDGINSSPNSSTTEDNTSRASPLSLDRQNPPNTRAALDAWGCKPCRRSKT